MRRISYRSYFCLLILLLLVVSLPQRATERLRSFVVCSFSPAWQGLHGIKDAGLFLATLPLPKAQSKDSATEIERLSAENQLLRSQMEHVRAWLRRESQIQEQVEQYKVLTQASQVDGKWKEFFKRRSEELSTLLSSQIKALPAKVIFREPASWSSTVWINIGEKENEKIGSQIISKNSPVVLGTSLIGVVEYVGRYQSRVRLITDAHLVPSVRAVRGKQQNRFLLEHLEPLLSSLMTRGDLFSSKDEATFFLEQLSRIKNGLQEQQGENFYLAKGELRGTSYPLWRSRGQVLKGIGFNYDFPDKEGPARDLRSGTPVDTVRKSDNASLLRLGDLLVTTGLDGVFPAGLRVGFVSAVYPLKEGASSYEIEAVPIAGNLDELTHVFVLSSIDKDTDKKSMSK